MKPLRQLIPTGLRLFLIARCIAIGCCLAALPCTVQAQRTGISTNLAYWATTTPNISIEHQVAPRLTLAASLGYNAFNFSNSTTAAGVARNPKLHHWKIMPEAKYWLCRPFERGYVGVHLIGMRYNVGGLSFPKFLKDSRYKGWGAGAGISYGYQWPLGTHWGMEASAGIGYVFLRYDKYLCGSCGTLEGRHSYHYVGPTRLQFSFIYYLR